MSVVWGKNITPNYSGCGEKLLRRAFNVRNSLSVGMRGSPSPGLRYNSTMDDSLLFARGGVRNKRTFLC